MIKLEDLVPLIHDPARVQQLVLSQTNGNDIKDPTNPFVMLMEASATMASAAATEPTAVLKSIYPNLATDTKDLMPHVTDEQLTNLFSYPSETNIVFYISLADMRSSGFRNELLKCFETTIPTGTVVTVTEIPFTLLNDINIKHYDNNVVVAEQLLSTDVISDNSLGILPSGIVTFEDSSQWIALETTVRQVRKSIITKALTAAEGFELSLVHSDKYYSSDVLHRDSTTTNGAWVSMSVTHNDTYIDPDKPTISVVVMDGKVNYSIPDVYLLSGQVSGELRIIMYETRGYLEVPMNKYPIEEFGVEIGGETTDPVTASIRNIRVHAISRTAVNGGKTGYTFEELRNNIIHNSLGYESLPITSKQLERSVSLYGLSLSKMLDMVNSRVYAATRPMERYDSSSIKTRPDIFVNTASIESDNINNSNVVLSDDHTLIPSGTLFKEVNGVTTICTDSEVAYLNNLPTDELIKYTKDNQFFYTPYYYLVDTSNTSTIDTRVYELDNPELDNIRIVNKNPNVLERVNVGKFGIIKTPTGYDIVISVVYNKEFGITNKGLLGGQINIKIPGSREAVTFDGVYDVHNELMTFKVDTSFNINLKDQLIITNGTSNVTEPVIDLDTSLTLYLYTTDTNVLDTNMSLVDELVNPPANTTVLDKETLTVRIGRPAKYLWNKMFTTYTDRKYLRHSFDKPLVYKETVYQKDQATGSIITVNTAPNGTKTAVKTILHNEGDPVLDTNGDPVMEYQAGEIVLDASGLPTIDLIGGVVRHVDILMLEYAYLAATELSHRNYLDHIVTTINSWLYVTMNSINSKVLENTKVLYRPGNTAEPVGISSNSIKTKVPYLTRPKVVLYSKRNDYTSTELADIRSEIGYIIHKYLDTPSVNLSLIRKEIIDTVDSSIVTAKISDLEHSSNAEVFSLTDDSKHLSIGKVLVRDNNNELIVNYDIDVEVHKV